MTKRRLLPWTIGLSLLLHGVAYGALHAPPRGEKPVRRQTQLRFDVVSQPKPPELAKPEPPKPEPPKPEPPKTKAPEAKPRVAQAEPLPEPVAAPPPVAAPADNGVTLAADGSGNAFSMPLSNGGALDPSARVHAPLPLNVPAPVKAAPSPMPAEPPLVAVGDLSARPSPPSLGAALERNYPADARHRGLGGSAKVRARIDPDGVVRRVSLLEESGAGFGAACTRTLSGSRWAPPKDKAGRSVATEIRYTCRFVVEP